MLLNKETDRTFSLSPLDLQMAVAKNQSALTFEHSTRILYQASDEVFLDTVPQTRQYRLPPLVSFAHFS